MADKKQDVQVHGEAWFNEMAKEWDTMPSVLTNTQNVHGTILKHLEEKGMDLSKLDVMEVGAGSGLLSVALAKTAKSVLAVDTSDKMLEKLQEKIKSNKLENISTLHGALDTIDQLEGRTFDVVVICMTLHHIDDIQTLTRVVSSSLKKGGRFLVFDFEKFEGSRSFHDMTEEQLTEAGVHHRDGFSAADLTTLFDQAGLTCEHAKSHFNMKMGDMPHKHAHGHSHGHGHSHRQGLGEEKDEYPIIFASGVKA